MIQRNFISMKYVIGVDFGSLSGRAVLIEAKQETKWQMR